MRQRMMMLLLAGVFTGTAWVGANGAQLAQQGGSAQGAETGTKKSMQDASAEGEKRFHQNCGRCHSEPTSISPRIAKTVLKHMRVRASLSSEDEKYILSFLAPGTTP